LVPVLTPRDIVVMDILGSYKSATIRQLIQSGARRWLLPPYSPDLRAFPYLNESDGFANQLVSDSNYLPMEVGRYVEGAFR